MRSAVGISVMKRAFLREDSSPEMSRRLESASSLVTGTSGGSLGGSNTDVDSTEGSMVIARSKYGVCHCGPNI